MNKLSLKVATAVGAVALGAAGLGAATAGAGTPHPTAVFGMQRSPGVVAAGCVPDARARVVVVHAGAVEIMTVDASGLPANTDFDLFVIQVPNTPFGVSWYQGDLETNGHGHGRQTYVGRFSVETFAVAPNTAPAPVVHTSPIPDAASNPPFGPVHTYHLGLWFNSPADAAKAGCAATTTPFNGEHNAGVQVLNTAQFPLDHGPLRQVES
jgi:hypothetical protein